MLFRNPIYMVMGIFKKVAKSPVVLARNGFLHSFHLVYICLILSFTIRILPIYLLFYLKVRRITEKLYYTDKMIQRLQLNKEGLLNLGKKGYVVRIEDLGISGENLESLKKALQGSHEVVIAEIDQDGFLLSHFGPIPNVATISERKFLTRKRFNMKLVAINGHAGVKKDYRGNKISFANEINALHRFAIFGINVPSILDIDFDKLTLTYSYILGPVLREELARKGAILRDRDVDNNPTMVHLGVKERWLRRIEEGKRYLSDVICSQFLEDLVMQRNRIHELGFIINDMKFGNVIIEKRSSKPYLIDFENSRQYLHLGKICFNILRDRDIEAFNLHFDTEMLTRKRIRAQIRRSNRAEIYAPVYFGSGLRMGNIWNVDSGYGRWHFILKNNLPSLSGKRILDLGANNAFNSIEMLRYGAHEVLGIEKDKRYIAQGNFVRKGFEWTDNTKYCFSYIQAKMEEIPTMNLGQFDLVLALCCIYYLDDDSIAQLVQHISTITNTFVLQCNIAADIGRSDPYTYQKASIEYALKVLRNHGFPTTKVIAPYRYSRPLVIGRNKK